MDNQKDIFKALIQTVKANDVDTKAPKQLNEAASANISLTGDSSAEVEQLMRMFKNAGMSDAAPAAMSAPVTAPDDESCGCSDKSDIPASMALTVSDMEDEHEGEYDNEPEEDYKDSDFMNNTLAGGINKPKHPADLRVKDPSIADDIENEDYENEPDDEYQDNEYMQHDLAGGINKPKKMYAKAQDGDNAMAVETIKKALLKALSEKKDAPWEKEGRWSKEQKKKEKEFEKKKPVKEAGKPDFLDVDKESTNEKKFSGYSKGNNKKGHPDQGKLVGESKEVNDIVKLALTEVNKPSANKTQHALDLKKLAGI